MANQKTAQPILFIPTPFRPVVPPGGAGLLHLNRRGMEQQDFPPFTPDVQMMILSYHNRAKLTNSSCAEKAEFSGKKVKRAGFAPRIDRRHVRASPGNAALRPPSEASLFINADAEEKRTDRNQNHQCRKTGSEQPGGMQHRLQKGDIIAKAEKCAQHDGDEEHAHHH